MKDNLSGASKRLFYLDFLKAVAILAVIVLHVTGKGLMAYPIASDNFNITLAFNSLFRFAVPIFVMCSGALFLNPERQFPVKRVFSKYLPRIIAALVFFALFYEAVEIIRVKINTGYFDINTINTAINNILTFNTHYHLYYLYIVVILYLSVPVLKTFLKSATEKNIIYLLIFLFIFSVILPFLRNFYPLNTYFKGMTSQYNLNLTYGMLTYFVLGHYLTHYSISKKLTWVTYILGILGLVVTFTGTLFFSINQGILYENFLAGNSPNVFFCAVALFMLIKKVHIKSKYAVSFITFISMSSFCVYLIHDLFIIIFDENNFSILSFAPILSIPLLTALIMIPSLICYVILRKVPLIKNIL